MKTYYFHVMTDEGSFAANTMTATGAENMLRELMSFMDVNFITVEHGDEGIDLKALDAFVTNSGECRNHWRIGGAIEGLDVPFFPGDERIGGVTVDTTGVTATVLDTTGVTATEPNDDDWEETLSQIDTMEGCETFLGGEEAADGSFYDSDVGCWVD